jgi:hypothetical protein
VLAEAEALATKHLETHGFEVGFKHTHTPHARPARACRSPRPQARRVTGGLLSSRPCEGGLPLSRYS